MKFRYLGRSGLQISALTFGNWLTQHSRSDVETASRCIRAAIDAGITSFDSADSYANGVAEECLGAALAGERRESLTVMTKVFFPVGPEPWGKNDSGLSRKHIMEGIDGSLRRLGMDYVDVYQAHRFDRFTPLEETMQAFADIVRSGKALYIGVSEWTPEALREGQAIARQLGFSLISNQAQYSMLWRVIESEVIPVSGELGISQLTWSPLAQGVLSGKYRPGRVAPDGSRATDTASGGAAMIGRWMTDDVLEAVQNLRPVAEDVGLTMTQLALAWVLKSPDVASALIGASRPEQIIENVRAVDADLPPETVAAVDAILEDVTVCDPGLTKQFTPAARPV
jgi:aryl-alcohol dehydrogenase-like predicted oxidoreductase